MGAPDSFSAKRTRPAKNLHLEVKEFGHIQLPVTPEQAERLWEIALPARYGQGEKTLLDRSVRDTWEIPKNRVDIDQRRWKNSLAPKLDLEAGARHFWGWSLVPRAGMAVLHYLEPLAGETSGQ